MSSEPRPHDLLRWFLEGFRAEVPQRLATRGIWHDRDGGSLLGSPGASGDLRALTEDDLATEEARLTDGDTTTTEESYRFPMRMALRELAGPGPRDAPYPFMARVLVRTAWMDGDWDGACRSLGIVKPVRRPYVYAALERLYVRYRAEPPPRMVRVRATLAAQPHSSRGHVNPAGWADARQATRSAV